MREDNSRKLKELYHLYETGMYEVAYDILGDRGLAEQSVTGSFEKIVPQLHKMKEVEDIKSQEFMYETVVAAATALLKARQREVWLFEFVEEVNQDAATARKEKFLHSREAPLFSAQYQACRQDLIRRVEIGEKQPSIFKKINMKLV